MKTREEKIKQQIDIQRKIQSAGFNIVNCGHCGSVVLQENNHEPNIECAYCDKTISKQDCPDFLYEGLELSEEFKN